MPFEIRQAETRYQGYLTVLAVSLVAGGETVVREVEDHGQAASVLPYDPERRCVLLVRLPRAPALWAGGPPLLTEAPAGMVEDGEAPEVTVRREALEEAGVRLGPLEPLGAPFASPGVSTERIALFLAPYSQADRIAAGGGVDGEQEHITVFETPLAEFWARVERGEVDDLKTFALAHALRVRHPELF